MTCRLLQEGVSVITGVDFNQDIKETHEYNNPIKAHIHKSFRGYRYAQ